MSARSNSDADVSVLAGIDARPAIRWSPRTRFQITVGDGSMPTVRPRFSSS